MHWHVAAVGGVDDEVPVVPCANPHILLVRRKAQGEAAQHRVAGISRIEQTAPSKAVVKDPEGVAVILENVDIVIAVRPLFVVRSHTPSCGLSILRRGELVPREGELARERQLGPGKQIPAVGPPDAIALA